ncbi:MAG: HAMP domain-containing histidine kinase [Armatimonadetes bacterium]|nr:HAMP domain-containing histidine kinase [Armatimonadota bacterium]
MRPSEELDMLIVPRANVRVNLTVAILLTVVLSWIISGGVANYYNYLNFRAFRQEMTKRSGDRLRPIPEPKFGLIEFLTGRPPIQRGPRNLHRTASTDTGSRHSETPGNGQTGLPTVRTRGFFELRALILHLRLEFGLAALAAAWLARKFTKPLIQLAKGADAFQASNFDYHIPARGRNEFAAVATAMNEMARQVSEQIHHLESDARRRRQFLADVAHELRSPVTTMETMAGALKDGLAEDPERRKFALSALYVTSQRMRRLVQDLMELARVDLTELPLNLTEIDLRELASSSIGSHEVEAKAVGIVLHPLDSTEPVKNIADPDRIAQILDNIIENAISYAGEWAEVRGSVDGANPTRIIISDTGKGIKSADLPYVLDPFYRADSARTPDDCHSGLGLSIACRLTEAHGGKLTISSAEGQGTTVTIMLPATDIPA